MRLCWAGERRNILGPPALLIAAALFLALAPRLASARLVDCQYEHCTDVERLPPGNGVDMGDIVRRAQRFYGVTAKVYIVSSRMVEERLPYTEVSVLVKAHQIHIPEIYHFEVERKHAGAKHYVWHYIIGHEMAHVYQTKLNLINAMSTPYDSVVMAELHADFLAGFFMARDFGLNTVAIQQLLDELMALPVGNPGDKAYHGEPRERFFMATQGALMSFRNPKPSLREASAQGIRCAFDMLASRNDRSRSLAELCN